MLAFDHVIMAVADLDAAAARLYRDHGLASVPGGRHAGHGTENRIVPLGPDYLELMAIADEPEAEHSPLAAWVRAHSRAGDRLAGLCLRTDGLDTWAKRLGTEPLTMSRLNHDGSMLSWRLAGFDRMLQQPPHPMFIEWDVPLERHPGRARAEHRTRPHGIAWVEVCGNVAGVGALLGDHDLDIRLLEGDAGVTRAAVALDDGEIVLR
jgi:hypothetical protein